MAQFSISACDSYILVLKKETRVTTVLAENFYDSYGE